MRFRRPLRVASLAIVCCLVGCAQAEDRRTAELVLGRHFDALRHRRYEAALANYDKHFFTEVTRAEWQHGLAAVVEKLGTFRSYEVSGFGPTGKRLAGPGTYLRFVCQVTYAKSISEETFYVFRKQGKSKFKIIGHQIDAEGLSK
jgi:hypothetical protein